ncbi:exonuclease 1 [Marchantia polymorpha subsp. ruderalis]|uniref:Exonuclease 1 n=1 Tax=Marchantia polymorpha subsp. ruderalis TaxID=1480154 RepID=A0AAF6BKI4_MARPO|nr:hypothetical protein Mp_5g20790 [Marchantia polymorpha subsp. ruderalis]BBN12519.1 hypothetical protein Mp_5g20790 [Marchantia polymorpha subsp. ruderalis]
MGIQGLLQALKPYIEAVHVKKYSGQRVGIDAYSWLHKGAYACSMELHQDDTRSKRRRLPAYVHYCMHRIRMLKYNHVTPVVVFDGGRLPLKAMTEQDRRRRRETNLENAQRKQADGDMLGAQELFQRSVEITPAMAHELIEVLREEGVEFVVAPYEADAQLAYLAGLPKQKGGIVAVISEDSDLLAYGCKSVLFKMDRYGHCEEICLQKLFECEETPAKSLCFKGFTQDLFLGMCVMAGCDFLPSIPGIGVKRAHALLAKYRSIPRVLSKLKMEKPKVFPENYMSDFSQAKAIFSHARVYDREERSLVLLNPLSEELLEEFDGDTDFLGPGLPQSRAKAIAEGRLDPITMEAFNSVPSPKTPGLAFGEKKEFKKNLDSTPSPITPFSMYSSKKGSPNFSQLSNSRQGSKPAIFPATAFSMFGSKRKTLNIFDSPPLQASESDGRIEPDSEKAFWCGTAEELIGSLVVNTHTVSTTKSFRPLGNDDNSEASQVYITNVQISSEIDCSVSERTSNDPTEADNAVFPKLKFSAHGSNSEASQSWSANVPKNPFKRKASGNSSCSLPVAHQDSRVASAEVQRAAEEIDDPSTCCSAGESILTSLRETTGDDSDCQVLSPAKIRLVIGEANLASQTASVTGPAMEDEDESSSSVLTELSPNCQRRETSPSDDFVTAEAPRPVSAHGSAGKSFARSRLGKVSKSKFSGHADRSSGGKKLKAKNSSPMTPTQGGILKFFKPVTL